MDTMKKIDNEDVKKLSFAVLCDLKKVCDQHGLSYSLTGGTLIGAIRHKGFIPWDDDSDIMMPRPDYDRLMALGKQTPLPFRLLSAEISGKDYGYPFAKACHSDTLLVEDSIEQSSVPLGVYVDIFPVDGMGNRYWTAKIRCMGFQFLHGLKITSHWTSYHRSKLRKWYYEPFRYGCYALSKLLSREYIDRTLDRFLRKKDYQTSTFAGRLVGDYGSREIMPKAMFEKMITVSFENEAFDAIADYDTFLRSLYGDYTQLPPPEKRVSHHEFEAYWKEV